MPASVHHRLACLIRPIRPSAPACRRRSGASIAALTVLTLLGLAGCGDGSAAIGAGPIRSVELDDDGRAWVLRAYAPRSPNIAVLLDLDPITGAAAPVLPRLPGDRIRTVTNIGMVTLQPTEAGAPTRLLLAGPEVGLTRISGPFAFRGAFPILEGLEEDAGWAPSGGPAGVPSPDGRHLLLLAPDDSRSPTDGRVWRLAVAAIASSEITVLEPRLAVPDRDVRWLDASTIAAGDRPVARIVGDVLEPVADDTSAATTADTSLAHLRPVRAGDFRWSIEDGDRLVVEALDRGVRDAVMLPGPVTDFAVSRDGRLAIVGHGTTLSRATVRDDDSLSLEPIEPFLDRDR